MSETERPAAPAAPAAPGDLDIVALQLVAIQHQLGALGGIVQASLISVQRLLAERDGTPATPGARPTLPPFRRDMAEPAGAAPAKAATFMSKRGTGQDDSTTQQANEAPT